MILIEVLILPGKKKRWFSSIIVNFFFRGFGLELADARRGKGVGSLFRLAAALFREDLRPKRLPTPSLNARQDGSSGCLRFLQAMCRQKLSDLNRIGCGAFS